MAEQQSAEHTARQFVRVNSLKVAKDLPHNEVAQALGEFEAQERATEARKQHGLAREWQRWLVFDGISEDDGDISRLQDECKELVKVWLKLQRKHPECGELLPGNHGVPSVSTLKTLVESTVQGWESRRESGFGKAKQQFISFCGALTSYSTLFSVIPQGSMYTSLFTGVISSLVKASARHDQNADGISRALAEISADMTFTQKQGSIYPTERIKQLVILLYIEFVKFLCHAMDWYQSSWGRFKAALDQNFYTREVRDRVNEIKDMVKQIEREASLESQGVLAQTHGRVMKLPTYQDFESLMGHICRQNEISDRNRDLSILDISQQLDRFHIAIGEMAQSVATATVERMLSGPDFQSPSKHTPDIISKAADPSDGVPFGKKNTREELEKASRPLLQYLDPSSPESPEYTTATGTERSERSPPTPTSPGQRVAGQIVVRLQAWISAARSQILWIMSPPFGSARVEASLAARHIVAIAERGCFPCVFVSLRRSDDEIENGTDLGSRRVDRLIALLYSLIRQLILLLPEKFEDSSDLPNLVMSLDGGEQSLPSAMQALETCLRNAPSLLVCVIDGVQLLEHEETTPCIDELLDILRVETSGRVLKVLLTSEGFFLGGSRLKVDERLDCTKAPGRRPGRGGQSGARGLEGVSFPIK